ncbi:MAG: hypothetical protein J6C77_00750 [Muribaculaceae bacterium]|nr:hypothetical protein [Muribaculaceae bacterium]
MTIFFTILAICIVTASIVCLFLSWRYSPAVAWAALLAVYLIPTHPAGGGTLLFWGVACLIAVGISILLPEPVATSRVGVPYMTIASLAGAFVGMLLPYSQAGMILGAVIGLILGAIAFSRTPSGVSSGMLFPSRKWINYACAKGFPIVITIATAAIAMLGVIRFYTIVE